MVDTQIANFRIVEKLGEGGMGVVYKGIDLQLDRPVAIKMLNSEFARNADLVERFRTEARAQANLNHTNLATLYAFLVYEGNAFMVMEYIEGETFEQIIRRNGPIPPQDAIPRFKQALLGIGAAHRMGIIHRDIKPSNLMLNRQGIVKVMDFGIAKVLGTRGMTRTGMQMGTLAYMSPEQIQNRPVDVRSDIYALGITLYEMLSGHVPFESDSDFQIMHDHIATPPPPPSHYYPYAPRQFESVILKALEKNPENRFQAVEELGAALEHPETIPAPICGGASSLAMPRPTVTEMGTGVGQTFGAVAYAADPAPLPVASTAERPQLRVVSSKSVWTSRNMAATAIAAVAISLLAVLLWRSPMSPKGTITSVAPAAPVVSSPAGPAQDIQDIKVASSGGGQAAGSETSQPSSSAKARSTGDQGVAKTTAHRDHGKGPVQSPSDTAGSSTMPAGQMVKKIEPTVTGITIPAGTAVTVRTIDIINSDDAQIGQDFSAVVDTPVIVGDRVVVPKGSDATLQLAGVKKSGLFRGRPELSIQLLSLKIYGRSYPVQSEFHNAKGASRGTDTARKVGGGGVISAIIGGIAKGGRGAGKGASISVGAGPRYLLATHAKKVKIPSETKIDFLLTDALTVISN